MIDKKTNVDFLINNQMKNEEYNYLEQAEKSLRFETGLRDCINRKKAINLRQFVRQELNSSVNLFGVPVLTLLSPDFVIDRYFMSAISLSLSLNGIVNYNFVYADLTNFACYERLQYLYQNLDARRLEVCKEHLAWFIETNSSVFFPLFNFIMTKEHFYRMMSPKVLNKYSNLEMNECSIYKEIVKSQGFSNNIKPSYSQDQILSNIDDIVINASKNSFFKMFSQNDRIKELEMLLFSALNEDRKSLSKITFNLSCGQIFGEHKPGEGVSVDSDFYGILKTILKER